MGKNILNNQSYSSTRTTGGDKRPYFGRLLKEGYPGFHNNQGNHELSASQTRVLSEQAIHQYRAEKEISLIQDPLWKRVCMDILNVLGPVAFKDLWKINLLMVPPGGKTAQLICPNHLIAEKVERYHFVFIGALKQFYPFLLFVEAKVNEPNAYQAHIQ